MLPISQQYQTSSPQLTDMVPPALYQQCTVHVRVAGALNQKKHATWSAYMCMERNCIHSACRTPFVVAKMCSTRWYVVLAFQLNVFRLHRHKTVTPTELDLIDSERFPASLAIHLFFLFFVLLAHCFHSSFHVALLPRRRLLLFCTVYIIPHSFCLRG